MEAGCNISIFAIVYQHGTLKKLAKVDSFDRIKKRQAAIFYICNYQSTWHLKNHAKVDPYERIKQKVLKIMYLLIHFFVLSTFKHLETFGHPKSRTLILCLLSQNQGGTCFRFPCVDSTRYRLFKIIKEEDTSFHLARNCSTKIYTSFNFRLILRH